MARTTHAEAHGSAPHTGRGEEPGCWEVRVPLHVTGFWIPVLSSDPLASGSLGAGLLLEPPVHGRLVAGGAMLSLTLLVEGRRIGIPEPVGRVIALASAKARLPQASIVVSSPRPLAVGYGVSGATALATALLLSAAAGLPLETGARIAHVAEVVSGTGLGDVIAQFQARMLEARIAPGAPGLGRVVSLPVSIRTVLTVELGSMTTPEMHRTLITRIAEEAVKSFTRFVESPCLETFLSEARRFSIAVGFAGRELARLFDSLIARGMLVGWYVKKRVAVLVPEPDSVEAVYEELQRLGYRVRASRVASEPAVVSPCTSPAATQGTGAS